MVAEDLTLKVSSTETSVFNSKKNLIALYFRTDLKKAKSLSEKTMGTQGLLNTQRKELKLMLGTIAAYNDDFTRAKLHFRECLKEAPDNHIKGIALNNLAMTSFYQFQQAFVSLQGDKDKLLVQYPDVVKDNSFCFSWLK